MAEQKCRFAVVNISRRRRQNPPRMADDGKERERETEAAPPETPKPLQISSDQLNGQPVAVLRGCVNLAQVVMPRDARRMPLLLSP